MESIHVRQFLRPIRYAFLVNEGDLDATLQAASLNAALWGGIFNPIIPLTPADSRNALLRAFDADLLVNLKASELTAELADQYKNRIVIPTQLVRKDNWTKRRELHLGFDIIPLLRYVHEKEVRFSTKPTRAALIVPQAGDGWPEFVTVAYGTFHWLPEMDSNFEEMFRRALRAQTIDLLAFTPPPGYETLLLPLDFTKYGLRLFGGPASFSSHIVFIGDHEKQLDLIEFWNIRASGCNVIFVPIAAYKAFEPLIRLVAAEGHYPINQSVENYADLQKSPTLSDAKFAEVCDWIATLGIGKLPRRNWRPRFGEEIETNAGDLYVAGLAASEGEEISVLQDRQMTPVKIIPPPHLAGQTVWKGQFRWSVEVTLSGGFRNPEFMFSFPKEPRVEEVVCRAVMGMPGEVRLGRRGIVIQQDYVGSILYLMPVSTKEVMHALFRQAGLKAEPSGPGQYAEQIVNKMGSLHGGCRVFKIRGVREILKRLGNGSELTKGNMHQIVTSEDPDEHGLNWRPELYRSITLRYGQGKSLDFGIIFDVLLEKRIIRPGFVFRCRTCFMEDWYHVSEFTEEYTCRYCFRSQRVNFASMGAWQYRADGLFRIPESAQGSVAVILSLWRFEHFAHGYHGRYVTSQNLVADDTRRRYEIDYAYVFTETFDTSYQLVLGQAKNFWDFTEDEMHTMAKLADRFSRKPYLAFSTLKDHFSDSEKARLRELAGRGYSVIALTREELDPYDLFDRFDRAPHKYAVSLKELSENTLSLNVGL
jgi:hypothetical protein